MRIPRKRKQPEPDPAVAAAAEELAQSEDSLAGAKAQLDHAERHVVAALYQLREKNNVTGLAAGLIRKGKERGDPGPAPG